LKNRLYTHFSGRILAQLFHRTIFPQVHLPLTREISVRHAVDEAFRK
jgi:hypothetical protein